MDLLFKRIQTELKRFNLLERHVPEILVKLVGNTESASWLVTSLSARICWRISPPTKTKTIRTCEPRVLISSICLNAILSE